MAFDWEKSLERWHSAGVIDGGAVEKIRAFEASRGSSERLRWPVLLALALGGLLLCAGVLLFVAAHWDELSPASRFSLVLLLVAAFPFAGAVTADRFRALSLTFFTIGTVCVGAGIFLSAQIFNLQENWPNGILLWAVGALTGWILLRNWTQAAILALLLPAWLVGEFDVRTEGFAVSHSVVAEGLLLLAATYLTARTAKLDNPIRLALTWIGGFALLPLAMAAFLAQDPDAWWFRSREPIPSSLQTISWAMALIVPLLLAFALRKSASWMNVIAGVWVLMIGTFHANHPRSGGSLLTYAWDSLGPYLWAGVGAIGLVVWGLAERRRERINLGVAGFALTVTIFYFSDVMDKLGRSASLIGMGILLLFGGWSLERTRRRLMARIQRSAT